MVKLIKVFRMKTFKLFFLIFVSSMVISCEKTSQEELVGDWQIRAIFQETPRAYATTFVIGDIGYVIGGYKGTRALLNDVLAFNHKGGGIDTRTQLSTGDWFPLSDLPAQAGARYQAVGFSLNGYGYMGTGWSYDSEGDDVIRRDFWRYDPKKDEWEEVAPLPATAKARRAAIAFTLNEGGTDYGYVGGGYEGETGGNYLADFWRFDPDPSIRDEQGRMGKWTLVTGYGGQKRAGAAVFVINNKAYIVNGENSQGTGQCVDFWMYDPSLAVANRWTILRKMNNSNPNEDYDDDYGTLSRSFGTAYVVSVGNELRGHVVGGRNNGAYNWEYDHNEDLWIQRTKFINNGRSLTREGMISFSFPNTGRAYVGLGQASTARFDDMWEFIPLVEDYTYDD